MSDPDLKLRHEFVGMMFAITIGEVGLQVAALVQAGHVAHFLPAYGHLLLATVVVAASWVGWSVSLAPGARMDVRGVFQWEFIVLLLDVSLVITYFILVRTVDFGKELSPRIDPASTVARWIFLIFLFYLVWDVITKIVIYLNKPDGHWLRLHGSRMIPTIACLILARIVWRQVESADLPHRLSADFALLCLVLLFRALKDLISASFPRPTTSSSPPIHRTTVSVVWSIVCLCGITLGTMATKWSWPLPLPDSVVNEINAPLPAEKDAPKPLAGLPSHEQSSPAAKAEATAATTK
jgi:hypothetical protein